jgi:pimeloyl-ACP methyl ester carboxylesterase
MSGHFEAAHSGYFEQGVYSVANDNLFGARDIHYQRVGHNNAENPQKPPLIVHISGFAEDCWDVRPTELRNKCFENGIDFLACSYSGLDNPQFDPMTRRLLVTGFSMARWKNDVEVMVDDVLEKNPGQDILLIVHSFGANAGFDIAEKYKSRMRGMIALAPATGIVEDLVDPMLRKNRDRNRYDEDNVFYYPIPPANKDGKWSFVPITRYEVESALKLSRVNNWVAQRRNIKINYPLIICADRGDPRIEFYSSRRLFRRIQSPIRPKLIEMPGAGHNFDRPQDRNAIWEHAMGLLNRHAPV